ncbi:MAG TPA: endolytic transglycosylase MltG [Dermatophilaceae bacterium]|nr:endolytic transglycosylase MltG [Dermatophilaceae bacterium]
MTRPHLKAAIFGAAARVPVRTHKASPDEASPDEAHDGAEVAPTRRSQRAAREDQRRRDDRLRRLQRRRVKRARRGIVLLVALGLVVGTGAVATSVLWPMVTSLTESNDYAGSGSGLVSVAVHGGDSSRAIGTALEKAGVVKSAKAFADAAASNPQSGSIQPGSYALHSHMSAASALTMLLNKANRTVPRVTIREGLWVSEVITQLAAATGRPLAEYTLALKNPGPLGLPAAAKGNAEGYLFPSTYAFEVNATAGEQLQMMVSKSLDELANLGVAPVNMQRVLTIASIVEAEARATSDGPKVARVIENRLAVAMPLQMDSTVHFLAHRRGKAGTTNAERARNSPYNTYRVKGLPPGPIDSPGVSSIRAALRPAPGKWMFFVAVNPQSGLTRFSVDAAGHAVNVKVFQQWCTAHPGQC